MLVHQHRQTEGASGNVVSIPEPVDFTNEIILSQNTFSGVIFGSDGSVRRLNDSGSSSSFVGSWLQNGAAASFTIRRTVLSGTLNVDQGSGWIALTTDRENNIQEDSQPNEAMVRFEISDDGGATVLDVVIYTFRVTV